MLIRHIGHAEFLLETESGVRIVTDPYDESCGYPMHEITADVALVSHHHHDHDAVGCLKGSPRIIDSAGEYTPEQGIRVTSLPGACALITALTMSGMPARRFCFEGFLPADKKERRYILAQLQREERTTILYEAPHHLRGTLQELYDNLGDRRITLCRELTKKFEEALPMTLVSAIEYYGGNEPRGEYVLVLAGADRAALEEEKRRNFEEMTLEEHMSLYTDQGLSRKEAMKKVAADRGVSKREIYRELL